MFGYLTMQNRFMTWKTNRCYHNYYCGTCFGLEQNYRQRGRMLLSYDVAILGILLGCHPSPLGERYHCRGQQREKCCVFKEGKWNQIAAINILLMNEKLKDDMNDDHSLRAFLGTLIFGQMIRKAQRAFPEMSEVIKKGYRDIYALEKRNGSVREIGKCFADMMEHTAGKCKKLEDWERAYIRCISEWIYYIDALDDYEKDFRKNKFNPLKKKDAKTFYEYTRKYIRTIAEDMHYLNSGFMDVLEDIPDDSAEYRILITLIREDIPNTTARILSGKKLIKVKIGSVWD